MFLRCTNNMDVAPSPHLKLMKVPKEHNREFKAAGGKWTSALGEHAPMGTPLRPLVEWLIIPPMPVPGA